MSETLRVEARASAPQPAGEPALVLAGFPAPQVAALAAELGPGVHLETAAGPEDAVDCSARLGSLVLCLGPELPGPSAFRFLTATTAAIPRERVANLVLAAGPALEIFQGLVDGEQLWFLCAAPPPGRGELAGLLRGALAWERGRLAAPDGVAETGEPTDDPGILLDVARTLIWQESLEGAGSVLVRAAREIVAVERARLWLWEPQGDTLWAPRQAGSEEFRLSAAVGLTSFVNRSGRALCLDHAGDDPRFDPDADGGARDRFLAAPVRSASGGLAGVLAVSRDAGHPPFAAAEVAALSRLAELAGAVLAPLAAREGYEAGIVRRHGVMGSELADMFRPPALKRHIGGQREPAPLLQISGMWLRWTYWLLLLLFAGAGVYSVFGSVREYATGWAVVRVTEAPGRPAAGRVLALLPGRYRPLVQGGMPLRLELQGFYRSEQRLVVDRVSRSVMGPSEARRLLGPEIGDAVPVDEPVFLVEAPLPRPTFHSAAGDYAYYDGMLGAAEVVVRSERILFNLLPGLRALFASP